MRILDLFSGYGGATAAFKRLGDDVVTADMDPMFGADLMGNVMDLTAEQLVRWYGYRPFDFVWASPPCTTFSVASIGRHWTGGRRAYIPKSEAAARSIELVAHMRTLIDDLAPRLGYIIENPRGVLRNLPVMADLEPATVWYCHYGVRTAKPTDLWSTLEAFAPRPQCHNQRPDHAPDCCCRDHDGARRGAKTGVQATGGKNRAAIRGMVPDQLSVDVAYATRVKR